MTLSLVPVEHDETTAAEPRGWAVVEIRHDGSLGRAELVSAAGAQEAARTVASRAGRRRAPTLSPPLGDDELGLLQAASGQHAHAARSFTRADRGLVSRRSRQDVLGHLALVEAYRGDLRRATEHAGMALTTTGGEGTEPGRRHARLAMAWAHLERAEDGECADQLDLVQPSMGPPPDPWLSTAEVLLEARLHIAADRPDAAVRLLAEEVDCTVDPVSGWRHGVLTAARADALVAEGEPHRAVAALTPLPSGAVAEGAVVLADAYLATGDFRGAGAVLVAAAGAVEGAPLTVQVRAWLQDARISAHRGQDDRAARVLARALRAVAAEDLLASLRREWHWVRQLVTEDRTLRLRHRELLLRARDLDAVHPRRTSSGTREPVAKVLAASLTERESEVLELLTQMYSTDEIAEALYVSANTVKTHLKGIFGKLCVNRRADAVRRGRQLGLC